MHSFASTLAATGFAWFFGGSTAALVTFIACIAWDLRKFAFVAMVYTVGATVGLAALVVRPFVKAYRWVRAPVLVARRLTHK
jgi:hypothetical protein